MTSAKLLDNRIETRIVTTPEEQRDALLVRAVSYADGDSTPLRILVDGNDYQATHFVAYIEDEPIGSSRVRWFRDFAKIERSCFVPKHRNPRALYTVASFVFPHIAMKGYQTVITYASPKYAVMWQRLLGFKPNHEKEPLLLSMSEGPYVELVKILEVMPRSICADSDGHVLERIEGQWDAPLTYER